jgi:WhiB family transcriptional regulator, redox-sensing transcriptional regulator
MWITDWTTQARCRGTNADELFIQGSKQEKAKLVCRGCPVRTECLADALDNGMEFGVWGGMTERERRALLRRRPDVTSWRDLLERVREEFERQSLEPPQEVANVLELPERSESDNSKNIEFEDFYKAEFAPLVMFLLKQGFSYHDANDKAQSAFAEAYSQWDKIEKPRPWIPTPRTLGVLIAPGCCCLCVRVVL